MWISDVVKNSNCLCVVSAISDIRSLKKKIANISDAGVN